MVFLSLVKILVDLFTIFFLLRFALEYRDFHFNPLLQPIYKVTEPPLSKLRALLPPTKTGRDFTPLLAIVLMILLYSAFMSMVVGSRFTMQFAYELLHLFTFLMQAYFVMLISTLLVDTYMANPIVRFMVKMTDPLTAPFRRMFGTRGGAVAMGCLIVFAIHVVACFSIIWFISHANYSTDILFNYQLRTSLVAIVELLNFYLLILFIRVIMSWLSPDPRNPIVMLLLMLTDPVLRPFQRIIPPIGGIDISPIFAFLLIGVLSQFLLGMINQIFITGHDITGIFGFTI